ncbi:MAG: hypothetical protein PHX74_12645 [Candidatus Sumerlaeales bacterium]|nr:hypothetical protein [Candidatus Sumerlaeales bacterium]
MYKVYIQTNSRGVITAINSDEFLPDLTTWTQIDEGDGDRCHHAQGNYFAQPIMTDEGVPRYKLADGKVVERTAAEIAADVAKIPPPPPSAEDRIRALETKLTALEPTITTLTRDVAAVKTRLPITTEPIVKEILP